VKNEGDATEDMVAVRSDKKHGFTGLYDEEQTRNARYVFFPRTCLWYQRNPKLQKVGS
jgi:hypothetical protein